MGGIMGKAMEESMDKQKEFMKENGQAQLERQVHMQNYMREQQMAMAVAKGRDLFHFWAAGYSVAVLAAIVGIRKGRPGLAVPVVPLTFIVSYFGDMAYGNKMTRIQAGAARILEKERHLLDLPAELPTLELLDSRREALKKN